MLQQVLDIVMFFSPLLYRGQTGFVDWFLCCRNVTNLPNGVCFFLTLTLNCIHGVNCSCHHSFKDYYFKFVCLCCNKRKVVRPQEAEEHREGFSTSFLVSLKRSSSPGVSLNICLFSSHFMKLNPSFHLLKPSATSPLSLIWSPPLPSLSPIPPSS